MDADNLDIRISAASLNKICFDDRYLLILNKNRLEKGDTVYTPVGGAIKVDNEGKKYLAQLGANFEDDNDLRLSIPKYNLPKFEEWFRKRENRETSPFRELEEELVKESGLLNSLSKKDVEFYYLGNYQMKETTDRTGHEGEETLRYLEVYYTLLSDEKKKEILNKVEKNDLVSLVTKEEIMNGMMKDGILIGSNALPLIIQYNTDF